DDVRRDPDILQYRLPASAATASLVELAQISAASSARTVCSAKSRTKAGIVRAQAGAALRRSAAAAAIVAVVIGVERKPVSGTRRRSRSRRDLVVGAIEQ